MKGYWNPPEETAKGFTPNGWLRTGDMCLMDERGSIRITDRKKDMIVVCGFKVFQNGVEDVRTLYPDVLEAAAIGIKNLFAATVGLQVLVANVFVRRPSSFEPEPAGILRCQAAMRRSLTNLALSARSTPPTCCLAAPAKLPLGCGELPDAKSARRVQRAVLSMES